MRNVSLIEETPTVVPTTGATGVIETEVSYFDWDTATDFADDYSTTTSITASITSLDGNDFPNTPGDKINNTSTIKPYSVRLRSSA